METKKKRKRTDEALSQPASNKSRSQPESSDPASPPKEKTKKEKNRRKEEQEIEEFEQLQREEEQRKEKKKKDKKKEEEDKEEEEEMKECKEKLKKKKEKKKSKEEDKEKEQEEKIKEEIKDRKKKRKIEKGEKEKEREKKKRGCEKRGIEEKEKIEIEEDVEKVEAKRRRRKEKKRKVVEEEEKEADMEKVMEDLEKIEEEEKRRRREKKKRKAVEEKEEEEEADREKERWQKIERKRKRRAEEDLENTTAVVTQDQPKKKKKGGSQPESSDPTSPPEEKTKKEKNRRKEEQEIEEFEQLQKEEEQRKENKKKDKKKEEEDKEEEEMKEHKEKLKKKKEKKKSKKEDKGKEEEKIKEEIKDRKKNRKVEKGEKEKEREKKMKKRGCEKRGIEEKEKIEIEEDVEKVEEKRRRRKEKKRKAVEEEEEEEADIEKVMENLEKIEEEKRRRKKKKRKAVEEKEEADREEERWQKKDRKRKHHTKEDLENTTKGVTEGQPKKKKKKEGSKSKEIEVTSSVLDIMHLPDLARDKIWDNLRVEEKKACMLVSKAWRDNLRLPRFWQNARLRVCVTDESAKVLDSLIQRQIKDLCLTGFSDVISVQQFLSKFSTLRCLDMRHGDVKLANVKEIISCDLPQLQELKVRIGSKQNEHLSAVFAHISNLINLEISACQTLNIMEIVGSQLKNLQRFSFHGLFFAFFNLTPLGQLEHMKELKISWSKYTGLDSLVSKFEVLQKLELSGCTLDSDWAVQVSQICSLQELVVEDCMPVLQLSGMLVLSRGLTKLKKLQLDAKTLSFQYQGPQRKLWETMPELQHLHLKKCDLDAVGLKQISLNFCNLKILELTSFCTVHDSAAKFFGPLSSLQELHIERSSNFSDWILHNLSSPGCQLKRLSLFDCSQVKAWGMKAIAKMGELKNLTMGNFPLTHQALVNLSKASFRLQSLTFQNCTKMTGTSLDLLTKAQSSLEEFSVTRCVNIHKCEFNKAVKNLPCLKRRHYTAPHVSIRKVPTNPLGGFGGYDTFWENF